jgi:hypothetical protein|tara:strand:- start:10 stop:153 length:144 start_codon:yes stop_codon:yes gene_type:complete
MRASRNSLGMQSVIYGADENPNVTAVDRIAKFLKKKRKKKNQNGEKK